MVDVFTEIIINRPLTIVADYAANPDHAPEWYANIHSAVWQTPKPLALGSKIAFKASFLGRELAYVYQIDQYIAGEQLVMRTADGPFPMETTYTWEGKGEHAARMTLRNRGNPSGFSGFVSPFMSWMMKKANRKDLEQLKSILEKKRLE